MTSGAKAQTGAKSTTSVTLAGDVTGPSSANTVEKINGSPLGTTTGATSGQYLAWNGSAWVPTTAAAGGVTSFNTRTGAVVPANADYLAVATGGLTGATTATRFVGGTANGAPASGTFAVGDFIVDQTSSIFVCVVAGTPGTWSSTISNHVTLRSATATAKFNEITLFTGSTAGQTISAAGSPIDSVTWSVINNSSVNLTLSFSANAMYVLGANTSVTTYTVTPGSAYSFVNYNGGNWYMTSTNDLTNGTGVLPTTNGGTGLSTIGTAGQVLTVNSGATALQYSTPATTTSVTMGGDVTGNSATSTVAKINGTALGTLSGATSGQVLAWNGTAWAPATSSGGAPGTTVSSFIGSNVSVTAGTLTNITSITLTAGTWLVSTSMQMGNASSETYPFIALTPNSANITTIYSSMYGYCNPTYYTNYAVLSSVVSIVLASTTTIYVVCGGTGSASWNVQASISLGAIPYNLSKISGIVAVKTA